MSACAHVASVLEGARGGCRAALLQASEPLAGDGHAFEVPDLRPEEDASHRVVTPLAQRTVGNSVEGDEAVELVVD